MRLKFNIKLVAIICLLVGLAGFALSFAIAVPKIFSTGPNNLNIQQYGALGDFISGTSGILITVSSTLLILVTLKQQKVDFEKSIAINNTSLENEKSNYKEQVKINAESQQEAKFFTLISVYQEQLKALNIIHKEVKISGREVLIILWNKFYASYKNPFPTEIYPFRLGGKHVNFSKFYLQNKTNLDIFFKAVLSIAGFIDGNNIWKLRDKLYYLETFKDLLTNEEQMLAFYYTSLNTRMLALSIKYRFFACLNPFDRPEHKQLRKKTDTTVSKMQIGHPASLHDIWNMLNDLIDMYRLTKLTGKTKFKLGIEVFRSVKVWISQKDENTLMMSFDFANLDHMKEHVKYAPYFRISNEAQMFAKELELHNLLTSILFYKIDELNDEDILASQYNSETTTDDNSSHFTVTISRKEKPILIHNEVNATRITSLFHNPYKIFWFDDVNREWKLESLAESDVPKTLMGKLREGHEDDDVLERICTLSGYPDWINI